MGRLILFLFALAVLAGCKPDHNLSPLEAALAGSWYHSYAHFNSPENDREYLELHPNGTGYWMVNRSGLTLYSNSIEVERWEVVNDTLKIEAVKPGYSTPTPNGEDVVVDSVWMDLQFRPLFISADSLILKEICSPEKRLCDGVMTWYNAITLEEMLTKPQEETTAYKLSFTPNKPTESE